MLQVIVRTAPRCTLAAALLAAMSACSLAAAAGYHHSPSPTESPTMYDAASTTIEAEGVRIEATIQATDDRPVQVSYRVHNTGSGDLAVFDRGDSHAVMTKSQRSGAVGQPSFRVEGNGALVLSHRARALPDPSPTVPPVPLAARLAPGQALEGDFIFSGLLEEPVQRVRWCLGVAPFDDEHFFDRQQVGEIEVWMASFALADTQQVLCTPWFDVSSGAFQAE